MTSLHPGSFGSRAWRPFWPALRAAGRHLLDAVLPPQCLACRAIVADHPFTINGDGAQTRDYTYVDDAVAGIGEALALAREGGGVFETVNVGSDHPIELNELIRVLGEEMGVEPVVEQRPPQPGDVTRTWADLTHARTLLGYTPSMDFREGIRRFVHWFEADRKAAG